MVEKIKEEAIYIAMPFIIFLSFMQVFSDKMFGIITPKIAESFSISPAEVSLLTTIAMLVFGVGGAVYSTLSDFVSPRKLFVFGALAFGIGSILGFVFQFSFFLVVLARAVQVAGAAVIPGCFIVVVRKYLDKERQAKYLGFSGAMYQLSAGLGSVLGGYVTQYLSWEFTMIIPVIVLFSVPVFWKYLPSEDLGEGKAKIDYIGIVLVIILFGLMLYGIGLKDYIYCLASIVFMFIYALYSRNVNEPIIDLSLFKIKKLLPGTLVGALIYSVQLAFFFIFAFIILASYDVSVVTVGLMYVPANFCAFGTGMISGYITKKLGAALSYYLGCVIIAISLLMFGMLMGSDIIYMWIGLTLFGIGFSIIYPGYYTIFSNCLPKSVTGRAMAVSTLISRMSYALAIGGAGWLASTDVLKFKVIPSFAHTGEMMIYSNICFILVFLVILSMLLFAKTFAGVKIDDENTD